MHAARSKLTIENSCRKGGGWLLTIIVLGLYSLGEVKSQSTLPVDTPKVRVEIGNLRQLIALGDSSRNTLYRISKYYSMVSERDSSLKFLGLAAELNYDVIDALADVHLAHARTAAGWPLLAEQIAAAWRRIHPRGDLDFALQIIEMVYQDQLNRYLIEAAIDTHGRGSEPVRERIARTNYADSVHMTVLSNRIRVEGWPTSESVGAARVYSAFVLVLHAEPHHQKQYLPMVREAVEKGELPASNLALLTDKIRLADGEKQVYGTQLVFNDSTGNYELYPVEDLENLDGRRLEVGLDSIAQYLRHMFKTYNRP